MDFDDRSEWGVVNGQKRIGYWELGDQVIGMVEHDMSIVEWLFQWWLKNYLSYSSWLT